MGAIAGHEGAAVVRTARDTVPDARAHEPGTTPSVNGSHRPFAQPETPRTGLAGMVVRVALPVVLLAGGGAAFAVLAVGRRESSSPAAQPPAIRTRVTELRVRDYPVFVRTHGVVRAHDEITLSAQVAGRIERVSTAFEVGAYFSEGDILVELDPRDYASALAVAEARHRGAKASLDLAAENHDRVQRLGGSVSQSELAQTVAARALAAAELDSAAAQRDQAQRDLERTRVRARFDGRVRLKGVGLGQQVTAGATLGVVFAVDYAEVRLPVAGHQIPFLDLPENADDPPVGVELRDAVNPASETVWKGMIVRTEGVLDANSLELFAIARVDDPYGRKSPHPPLRIGQPVVGAITGRTLTDVVAIPRDAVRQLDQVFLVDRTSLTLTSKTVAAVWSDEDHVVVRDPAIRDGVLVATTHIVYAPNGAKIELIPDIAPRPAGPAAAAKR